MAKQKTRAIRSLPDLYRLAAEVEMSIDTIYRFLDGGSVNGGTKHAIVDAAKRMGLDLGKCVEPT